MIQYFFLLLGIGGLIDSLYLLKESKKETLVCPLNFDCKAVLNSKWSKMFGVKNEIWGSLYYFSVTIISLGWILELPFTALLLLVTLTTGFLYSLYLIYLQAIIIKNYCFYCMISAGINIVGFITILVVARPYFSAAMLSL